MDRNKLFLIILLFILIIPFVASVCEEGQIDINTASLEELDILYGIGPSKAQAIIDTRPFDSVNDLINVSGIGEITLGRIIEQGLACVEQETELPEDSPQNQTDQEEIPDTNQTQQQEQIVEPVIEKEPQNITPELINLTPKGIKSEDDEVSLRRLNEDKFAIYGFLVFSILLIVLITIRWKKRRTLE